MGTKRTINRIAVNGCSYLEHYTNGNGHIDLAKQLSIPVANTKILCLSGEIAFKRYEDYDKIQYAKQYKQIVNGLHWHSNEYQFNRGALADTVDIDRNIDEVYKHVASGQHRYLNEFLIKYINDKNLLV